MPRKSPRARRKPDAEPRIPGKRRPRATPGRTRAATRGKATRQSRHATRGARPAQKPVRTGVTRPSAARRPRPAVVREAPRGRFRPPEPARVQALLALLEQAYPDATTALHHQNALQLLIATILSAQCTDERVNMVTPALFARYPDAAAFAGASRTELEEMVRSTGFYRNKAKSIQTCCAELVARYGGDAPRTLDELTALPGGGRNTANVVLGNAFGIPGIVVDTHVARLSRRLGLTRETDPVKI